MTQPTHPHLSDEPAVQINGAPSTAHSLLAALLDIYDDAQNNAPEHRCYIDSAWSDVLKEARQFLAAQPKADSTEPAWWHCECDDPDYSQFFRNKADAVSHLSDHPGELSAVWNYAPERVKVATPSQPLTLVLAEVAHERSRQDAQWGGANHDNGHVAGDWCRYISKQVNLAIQCGDHRPVEVRERMVKIAALAVAAIESMDRKAHGIASPTKGEGNV